MSPAVWIVSTGIALLACASSAGEVVSPLPAIPGLTAEDRFPRACVDCHVIVPGSGMDERLSTKLRAEQFNPALLPRIRAILPDTVRISGRHPRLPDAMFRNIPAGCLTCHRDSQTNLPALGPMMHAIHLTGGSDNHYLTLFGGQCTNCHKFSAASGRWSIPSGAEN